MNTQAALAAFANPRFLHDANHIRVVTKNGCEYAVPKDVIEVATDDFTSSDGYVYGTRLNGRIHMRGRRRADTRDQLRWFFLRNVSLKAKSEGIET